MNFNNMLQQYDPDFDNESMIRLAKETEDKELKDKIINNNIRIAVKLANKWKKTGYKDDLDDLVSLGMFGLIMAFNTYDSSKNIKFVTYAGRVVWMEFVKAERYKHMKCRGSFDSISFDATLFGNGEGGKDRTVAETLSNESHLDYDKVEEDEFNGNLADLIESNLTDKEKTVSYKYFFEGEALADISKQLKVSRQAVHQAYKRSVTKLAPAIT